MIDILIRVVPSVAEIETRSEWIKEKMGSREAETEFAQLFGVISYGRKKRNGLVIGEYKRSKRCLSWLLLFLLCEILQPVCIPARMIHYRGAVK